MFFLIRSSTEYDKHSKESELYDEESLDKTIDDSDKDDSSQESASKSTEYEKTNKKPYVGRYSNKEVLKVIGILYNE